MEFWSKLPAIFKKDVIGNLDYKSRCRLRKCSKSEKNLVNSCPVILDSVKLEPRIGNQIYFSIEQNGILLNDKASEPKLVIQDFLLIFKNRKSEVKFLTVDHYNFQRQPDAINNLVSCLLSDGNNLNIKIQKLKFQYGEIDDKSLLSFVKAMDSKTFDSLAIRKFPIKTQAVLDELVATEQWKTLKELRIDEKISIPIYIFLHLKSFSLSYYSMNSADVWKCIEKFRFTKRPIFSFFEIFVTREFSIFDILSHFDVRPENEPIGPEYVNNAVQHTQIFELSWSNEQLFVMKIGKRFLRGAICRKNFLHEDYEKLEDL
ncbi:hypothetical protein L3Y34_006929 [Caenorhabditis briggsae]|uniref:DUF38 domain-containing protein n=1 Tax=Caenorhabditis briggsae TaxID=6238 RepID=A0AAE8ZVG7_CAEBR|nr:hypothetical protein L3Y34_006929 [Caenorhabditis briggsae]